LPPRLIKYIDRGFTWFDKRTGSPVDYVYVEHEISYTFGSSYRQFMDNIKTVVKKLGYTKTMDYNTFLKSKYRLNINKIYSMINSKNIKSIPIEVIREFLRVLEPMTVDERMHTYLLKRDRADVIVPALRIYANTMKWANIDEIYVPKIGLADGLINHLYEQVK
jgi:exopolyphosphatase/guanosine-5'-triphosphate,3'-diphosphate pyrophosphatase